MNKRELDLLEKVFAAEIDGSIGGGLSLFQTRSKLAQNLEEDGYLVKVFRTIGGRFPVTIEGYRLTLKGNFAYCSSERCDEAEEGDLT